MNLVKSWICRCGRKWQYWQWSNDKCKICFLTHLYLQHPTKPLNHQQQSINGSKWHIKWFFFYQGVPPYSPFCNINLFSLYEVPKQCKIVQGTTLTRSPSVEIRCQDVLVCSDFARICIAHFYTVIYISQFFFLSFPDKAQAYVKRYYYGSFSYFLLIIEVSIKMHNFCRNFDISI